MERILTYLRGVTPPGQVLLPHRLLYPIHLVLIPANNIYIFLNVENISLAK